MKASSNSVYSDLFINPFDHYSQCNCLVLFPSVIHCRILWRRTGSQTCKLEASFQNVSKIAEEYTTKKLAKRNHGKFTESFTERHDKCNSIDRDSKITKDIQAEHFTYESKKKLYSNRI